MIEPIESKIKDCPFCGAKAGIYRNEGFKIALFTVVCTGPKTHSLDYWNSSEEEAIEEWNERV